MFIQEFYSNIHGIDTFVPLFATKFRGTRIVVTSDLISKVLHVLRVVHPDYPVVSVLGLYPETTFCLTSMRHLPYGVGSKTPHVRGFAKGSRFLNLVITFVLTSLSYYNSITKPRAHFLLSLL